jgi:hypothetical protein
MSSQKTKLPLSPFRSAGRRGGDAQPESNWGTAGFRSLPSRSHEAFDQTLCPPVSLRSLRLRHALLLVIEGLMVFGIIAALGFILFGS